MRLGAFERSEVRASLPPLRRPNRYDQATALSVPLLAPIIHGHPPGVLPTCMAIEEQKVAAQPMPRGRYSAFAA